MSSIAKRMAQWRGDVARFEAAGVYVPDVKSYLPPEFRHDWAMAMDAQPTLVTDVSGGIPAFLTTMIDPEVFEVLFAPTEAANIFEERRKGTWTDETAMFPIVEHTGEVSSYDDYSENGRAGANTNFPQRQSYLFQVIKEVGDRELARMGLARLNWVSEIDGAAADALNKFSNITYFLGVLGLQNYGALNDPNLSAPLTPATKAATGVKWIVNGQVVATANEVYNDIQSIYLQLVVQAGGRVNVKTPMILALSPGSEVALTATNTFNVNVEDLLKKNFPNLTVMTAVQYGVVSAANPNGNSAGNLVQLIAREIGKQKTGYCAFNEKMRSHPLVRGLSSFKQKLTAGTWGTIFRQPFGIAQMVGV